MYKEQSTMTACNSGPWHNLAICKMIITCLVITLILKFCHMSLSSKEGCLRSRDDSECIFPNSRWGSSTSTLNIIKSYKDTLKIENKYIQICHWIKPINIDFLVSSAITRYRPSKPWQIVQAYLESALKETNSLEMHLKILESIETCNTWT